RADASGAWRDPQALEAGDTPRTAAAPALAASEDGALHVVWFDTSSGGWLLYAASAPGGGDFGAPERVGEIEAYEGLASTFVPAQPALVATRDRRYAAWTDPRGGVYFSSAPAP